MVIANVLNRMVFFIVVLWKQHEIVPCVCFDYIVIWTCNRSRGRDGKTRNGGIETFAS